MRMPNEGEDLTGKVCVCSLGRAAIVTGRKMLPWGESWVGLGLDGRGVGKVLWASTNPCVIAESGQEYHDRLESIFRGKAT
jgi:hypothetical protein